MNGMNGVAVLIILAIILAVDSIRTMAKQKKLA